jgi:probable F420-dependent oxidoreductase
MVHTPDSADEGKTLEIGMSLRGFSDIAATARQYEQQGYDYLTAGEHISFHVPMPSGIVSLSVAAGATSTIKLLSAITLVPLYPPVLLAKLGAALDVASGGRFNLGVGVGGEHPPEFEACGVPVAERGARTNEALEILTRLWAGGPVSFHGRFTNFNDISIQPAPMQRPRPPIWVSGRSEAAMRRAARFADAWMPYMYTPDMVADSTERIRSESGRAVRSGLLAFYCVHPDGATGRAMAAERLSEQYQQDFERLVDRYALAGTPEQVISQARRFIDAGVTSLMVASACPASYLQENLALFTGEVLPALRAG